MRLKRLELNVEFDNNILSVFHTDGEVIDEPPTIVSINGEEFEGEVSFYKANEYYELRIKKL